MRRALNSLSTISLGSSVQARSALPTPLKARGGAPSMEMAKGPRVVGGAPGIEIVYFRAVFQAKRSIPLGPLIDAAQRSNLPFS